MRKYIKYFIYLYVLIGFSHAKSGSFDAFFRAIKIDNDASVRSLLAVGFDPNIPSENLTPALIVAIDAEANKTAKLLINDPRTQVNVDNPQGESALMLAAIHNQLDIAELLIARGAEVNRPGWSPLHYAASKGNIAMMRLLLDQSAYIDAESPEGNTPLMMAAHYSKSPLAVKLLLEEGADPTLTNKNGNTALELARSANQAQSAAYIQAFVQAWELKALADQEAAQAEAQAEEKEAAENTHSNEAQRK
jgi:hypothetical protein